MIFEAVTILLGMVVFLEVLLMKMGFDNTSRFMLLHKMLQCDFCRRFWVMTVLCIIFYSFQLHYVAPVHYWHEWVLLPIITSGIIYFFDR